MAKKKGKSKSKPKGGQAAAGGAAAAAAPPPPRPAALPAGPAAAGAKRLRAQAEAARRLETGERYQPPTIAVGMPEVPDVLRFGMNLTSEERAAITRKAKRAAQKTKVMMFGESLQDIVSRKENQFRRELFAEKILRANQFLSSIGQEINKQQPEDIDYTTERYQDPTLYNNLIMIKEGVAYGHMKNNPNRFNAGDIVERPEFAVFEMLYNNAFMASLNLESTGILRRNMDRLFNLTINNTAANNAVIAKLFGNPNFQQDIRNRVQQGLDSYWTDRMENLDSEQIMANILIPESRLEGQRDIYERESMIFPEAASERLFQERQALQIEEILEEGEGTTAQGDPTPQVLLEEDTQELEDLLDREQDLRDRFFDQDRYNTIRESVRALLFDSPGTRDYNVAEYLAEVSRNITAEYEAQQAAVRAQAGAAAGEDIDPRVVDEILHLRNLNRLANEEKERGNLESFARSARQNSIVTKNLADKGERRTQFETNLFTKAQARDRRLMARLNKRENERTSLGALAGGFSERFDRKASIKEAKENMRKYFRDFKEKGRIGKIKRGPRTEPTVEEDPSPAADPSGGGARARRLESRRVRRGKAAQEADLAAEAARAEVVAEEGRRTSVKQALPNFIGRFGARAEQREAELEARRALSGKKLIGRARKYIDDIRTLREDEGFAEGYKLRQLYIRLGNIIKANRNKLTGGEEETIIREAINQLAKFERGISGTVPDIDRGVQTPAVPEIPGQPAVEARAAIPAQPARKGKDTFKLTQRNLEDFLASKAGMSRLRKTDLLEAIGLEYVAGSAPTKTAPGRAAGIRDTVTGEILSRQEAAARMVASAQQGGEFINTLSSFRTDKSPFRRTLAGAMFTKIPGKPRPAIPAQPAVEGRPAIPAVPGRPARFEAPPLNIGVAARDKRIDDFIIKRALQEVRQQQYPAGSVQGEGIGLAGARLGERLREQTQPNKPFNPIPAQGDIRGRAREFTAKAGALRGFTQNFQRGDLEYVPGGGDVFTAKAFPGTSITDPASLQSLTRAAQELEQVEPQFREIMGELTQVESKDGPKAAEGTSAFDLERAQGLRKMFTQKREEYLKRWAAEGTMLKTAGLDTLPKPAESYEAGLTKTQRQAVQMARVMEAFASPIAEEEVEGEEVFRDIDEPTQRAIAEERKGERFAELNEDRTPRVNPSLRAFADDILANILAFEKQASLEADVQPFISSFGNNLGAPPTTFVNAALKNLQDIDTGATNFLGPLIPKNNFGNTGLNNVVPNTTLMGAYNKVMGRIPYFDVAGNRFDGPDYLADLIQDYNDGKMPIQIITDSKNRQDYLYPTTVPYKGIDQVVGFGREFAQNRLGTVASIQKAFVGSRPVYWAHTYPTSLTGQQRNGKIVENAKYAGRQSKLSTQGGIKITNLVNPVVDSAGKFDTFLGRADLQEGDAVHVLNDTNPPTVYSSDAGAEVLATGAAEEEENIELREPSGREIVVDDARAGLSTTILRTAEGIRKKARQQQRAASLGLRFAGRTQTTIKF